MLVYVFKQWARVSIISFLVVGFLCIMTGTKYPVYASQNMPTELPGHVTVVKNEKQMINRIIKGMKKHQSYFSFYYPGIGKDFARYGKQSSTYAAFMDKLAAKNGYLTGILSGTCITVCGEAEQYVTFQFYYLTTKAQERKIDKKVKSIVRRFEKGDAAVGAKQAHDYLICKMQYDAGYYSPYDAFTKGRGLCMSYALAYQRLLQEMKIPCVYVKGSNHAWNMVKIGKYWYNVDVTWDDSKGGGYRYFLKSDADFPNHKRPKSVWLSSLKKAKVSYKFQK